MDAQFGIQGENELLVVGEHVATPANPARDDSDARTARWPTSGEAELPKDPFSLFGRDRSPRREAADVAVDIGALDGTNDH